MIRRCLLALKLAAVASQLEPDLCHNPVPRCTCIFLEISSPNHPFQAADANAHLAIDKLFFNIFSLMLISFDFIDDLIILKIIFENSVL